MIQAQYPTLFHRPLALIPKFKQLAIVLLSVLFLLLNASILTAADPVTSNHPQAMLIVDGSGSMWGKIKEGHKILVARKAIAGALRPFEDKIRLGLMSYGHRKRAACLDIQVIQRPSMLNPLQFSRRVNRIKPIGKTPITSSLNQAKAVLSKSKTGGSIILLADGPENCRKDPCSLITPEFAKKHKIVVHVIAFSMQEKHAVSLQCLSRNSGGTFSTPSNLATLEAALSKSLKASLQGLRVAPPSKEKVVKKIVVKPGIQLSAHLGPRTSALVKGINWKIEKLAEDKKTEQDFPPWISSKPTPNFDLNPGSYRITADFDDYQLIKVIQINKGSRELERFVFNLSELNLPAGWAPPDSRSGFGKLLLEAQKKQKSSDKNSESIIVELLKQAQTRLIPAGAYKISGIENGKMLNWYIHAQPGKVINIPIWSKTGRVRFELRHSATSTTLDAPIIKIYATKLKPDALVEVARSTARAPQFDLAPGKYLAHIINGHAQVRHSFSVKPNVEVVETVTLQQGSLKIDFDKSSGTEIPSLEILHRADSTGKGLVAELTDLKSEIKLSPGKYRLVFRTAPTARASIRDISLKDGDIKLIRFKSRQSKVSFSVSKRNDALSRHQIFWQLFDKKGRMIWQSTEPEPRLLLSEGSYNVVAEIGNDKFKTAFRLKGLKDRNFDLSNKLIK